MLFLMLISALETLLKGLDKLEILDQNVRRYHLFSHSDADAAISYHASLHRILWHTMGTLNQKAKMNADLFLR